MSEDVTDASRTKPRSKRKVALFVQLLLALALLLGIWFSFQGTVLNRQSENVVPERFGALELVTWTEGPEALASINKLHGGDIDLTSAYIAQYANQGDRAMVWVGTTKSEDAAAELTRRMIEGIERGGSGFSNLQRLTIAGHEVFQVEGPGGKHFFYNSWEPGEIVVWLTIEAENALAVLEQAVKTF